MSKTLRRECAVSWVCVALEKAVSRQRFAEQPFVALYEFPKSKGLDLNSGSLCIQVDEILEMGATLHPAEQ